MTPDEKLDLHKIETILRMQYPQWSQEKRHWMAMQRIGMLRSAN